MTVAHSIFVRDITENGYRNMKMIAHAIQTPEDAETLVRGVAASYPEHGYEETTQVSWFRDKDGLHEIWAYPAPHVPGRTTA